MIDLDRKIFWCILLLLFGAPAVTLSAQGNNNPFDLHHRLRKANAAERIKEQSDNPFDINTKSAADSSSLKTSSSDQDESASTVQSTGSANPFDIQRSAIPPLPARDNVGTYPATGDQADGVSEEKERGGFLFWTLLIVIIFLALMITLYRSVLSKIYRAFSNENVLKLLQREQGGIVKAPYWFLYFLFTVNGGIFFFLIARYYAWVPNSLHVLLLSIGGVSLFFFFKHIVLKFIESIFPFAKSIKQYSFTIVIFSIILGLILIPFNVFIAFAPDRLTFIGVILALLTVLIVYLFRFLRTVMISTKFLMFHKFHFFMYLCTIEIAPLLIVIKLLLKGLNVQ